VWVRWDSRVVRILNLRGEQVQIHTRREPGKFSRALVFRAEINTGNRGYRFSQ
jgi:hypothetical protein